MRKTKFLKRTDERRTVIKLTQDDNVLDIYERFRVKYGVEGSLQKINNLMLKKLDLIERTCDTSIKESVSNTFQKIQDICEEEKYVALLLESDFSLQKLSKLAHATQRVIEWKSNGIPLVRS